MTPFHIIMALVLWIIVGVLISHHARRYVGITLEDFYLANRTLGGFISAMTYSATTFSAFMMIGLVGLVYATGVGAYGFEMTYLIFTVILLVLFAPRFWCAGQRFNYLTPSEMLSDRYDDPRVGTVMALVCLVMLVPYTSIQMMGIGFLFSGLTGGALPYYSGVITMAVFSGFVAVWAGMKSVSWTDAFQAMTMLFSAIILLFYIIYVFFGGPISFFSTVENRTPELLKMTWDIRVFIGLTFPWAFFALTNPQVSQRMFVSKNIVSLKKMIIYFAIFGFIYTIITTLLGFSAANVVPGLTDPDGAMPALLVRVPTVLSLIIFLGIFAAAASTLSSIALTLSSMVTRDVGKVVKKNISEKSEVFLGKATILVLIILCVIFSFFRFDLIAILSAMSSGGLLVTAPSLIGTFFWKNGSAKGALWSMLVGGFTTGSLYITAFIHLGEVTWWPSILGFLVTLSIFVGLSLIDPPPKSTERFLNAVNQEMEKQGFS